MPGHAHVYAYHKQLYPQQQAVLHVANNACHGPVVWSSRKSGATVHIVASTSEWTICPVPGCPKKRVAAPRAPRARTAASISGQTPVHHPKIHPPKQPTAPEKS